MLGCHQRTPSKSSRTVAGVTGRLTVQGGVGGIQAPSVDPAKGDGVHPVEGGWAQSEFAPVIQRCAGDRSRRFLFSRFASAPDAGPRSCPWFAPQITFMPPKVPFRVFVAMCAIFGGLQLDEQLSNIVLPLTLRHFTASASVIIGVDPLGPSGVRIPRAAGRRDSRRSDLDSGGAAGLFPRHLRAARGPRPFWPSPQASSFWQLLALIVLFQLFFAMLWGLRPSLGRRPCPRRAKDGGAWCHDDGGPALRLRLRPVWRRLRHGTLRRRLSLSDRAAAGQIGLVAFAALFLNEQRVAPAVRPKLTPGRYVRDVLGDRHLRRFALLGFTYAAFISSVTGFVVLFAVKTLRLGKGDVRLRLEQPVAGCARSSPSRWACWLRRGCRSNGRFVGALAMIAMVGCAIGLWAGTAHSLYAIAIVFGFGMLTADVIIKLLLQRIPAAGQSSAS